MRDIATAICSCHGSIMRLTLMPLLWNESEKAGILRRSEESISKETGGDQGIGCTGSGIFCAYVINGVKRKAGHGWLDLCSAWKAKLKKSSKSRR